VFLSERGAPMSAVGFRRMITRLGGTAKMPFQIHPHMLRHACGYILANRGVDTLASTFVPTASLVRQWYEPHLQRMYDDGHLRAADIAQLEQIAAGYGSRERFLTELTLDPPDATSDRANAALLDEDYTVLSTIHSAKGREWRIVRILNVVDGCIDPPPLKWSELRYVFDIQEFSTILGNVKTGICSLAVTTPEITLAPPSLKVDPPRVHPQSGAGDIPASAACVGWGETLLLTRLRFTDASVRIETAMCSRNEYSSSDVLRMKGGGPSVKRVRSKAPLELRLASAGLFVGNARAKLAAGVKRF
jgi:Phage integrase family